MLLQFPITDADNEESQGASCSDATEAVASDFESHAAKTEDERAEDTELDKFLTRLHH